MGQLQGGSSSTGGRLDGSLQKTAPTAASFALGAGWGTTGSATMLTGSTDQRGQITITASGASFAQATATVVFTFADGAFASAPFVIVTTTNDNSIDTGKFTWTSTTTAVTFTFSLLPVDTKIYKMTYVCIA
ncbi:MAG TPA: hypothetical protein VMY88_01560 [Acidimicrobiales bacterium]|nr:hypothetical protein [Acidimicrobiales bacterium]